MLSAHWPLLDLRLSTPRPELRLPAGGEPAALADLAAEGVHHPDRVPFLAPWTALPPRLALFGADGGVRGRPRDLGPWRP